MVSALDSGSRGCCVLGQVTSLSQSTQEYNGTGKLSGEPDEMQGRGGGGIFYSGRMHVGGFFHLSIQEYESDLSFPPPVAVKLLRWYTYVYTPRVVESDCCVANLRTF